MAGQRKTKRQQQASQQAVSPKKQQSTMTVRKVFTIIICVVVALGLMLPVTGIGMASCSSTQEQPSTQEQQP